MAQQSDNNAGLQFSISQVADNMKKSQQKQIGQTSHVYLSAVLEYVSAELSELSGNAAKDDMITVDHIKPALTNDSELSKLFENNKIKEEDDKIAYNPSETDDKEEDIYIDIRDQIIVARNRSYIWYLDRARRILRNKETLIISALGTDIAMTCSLVETLKTDKIATIESISTGMNVEPYFNSYGVPVWSPPQSMITFHLKRGEFASYISGYHQRKIIEIFENLDEKSDGCLSLEKIDELKLDERFKSNEEQKLNAIDFKKTLDDKKMDLPTFIKYASCFIHPLLRDKIFKNIIFTEFNINIKGQQPINEEKESKDKEMALANKNTSYNSYIYKVLQQVHAGKTISKNGIQVLNSLIEDLLNRICGAASQLCDDAKTEIIEEKEIKGAVALVITGEMGKHAQSEGTKAVSKYNADSKE